jgi:hypothetical protein
MENETIFNVFIGAMYVSIFGLLIMSSAIPIALTRGKHSILPYYILYQVFISILLSTLFLCFGLEIMAISFGVTGVVFGIMALLGHLSKGSLHGLGLLSLAFFFGAIGLVLVNIFLQSETVAWIVSFVMFAYILFITMYDVRRIKDIINSGYENNNNNLVLYCAYILYVDYINILIRIVLYIAKAKSND